MDCDLCSEDVNEVFILRKEKFSRQATKREAKASRVCWSCGRHLFFKKKYNFGHNWRNVFLDGYVITNRNRERFLKYLEVHI